MKIQLNLCPICGEIFIDRGKLLPNHRQVLVKLSDGNSMYVAFCRKHEVTEELLKELTEKTLKYMSEEASGDMKLKYEQITYIGKA